MTIEPEGGHIERKMLINLNTSTNSASCPTCVDNNYMYNVYCLASLPLLSLTLTEGLGLGVERERERESVLSGRSFLCVVTCSINSKY